MTATEIVVALLEGTLLMVKEMSTADDPIRVDDLFDTVCDTLRVEPTQYAVNLAKSRLDTAAMALLSNPVGTEVALGYLSDPASIYTPLLFERGRQGLVTAIESALGSARLDLMRTQIPLWMA